MSELNGQNIQAISALETALEDATMDADWARGTKEARHF